MGRPRRYPVNPDSNVWYKPSVNPRVREGVTVLTKPVRFLLALSTILALVATPASAFAGENCTPDIMGIRHCAP